MQTFKACIGRSDVPLEWFEKGLNDGIIYVRIMVAKILFDRGHQFPLIRTFEPADRVYKQCSDGAFVVAEIPKTAQVRGSLGEQCRASEAVIVEVIPNLDGYSSEFSYCGFDVTNKLGEHIVIDDFDQTNEKCSTGFHFFNTIGEARDFRV